MGRTRWDWRRVPSLRTLPSDPGERADLYAALLVMATIDPWGYNLREEIAAMLQDDGMEMIKASSLLRETFQEGKKEGRRQAIEMMLRRLFLRRLGRTLTEQEQQALADRARVRDPQEVEDRALSLEGEALSAWLLDPNAR